MTRRTATATALAVLLLGAGLAALLARSPARSPARNPVRPAPAQPASVPDYAPLARQLAAYANSRPAHYTIYFQDLATGREATVEADRPVYAASTIKVPIVLYLNTLVAEGKAAFDTRVTYSEQLHYEGGAGILHLTARDGDTFSLRVLANLAITISDNVATNMLLTYLGREETKAFLRSLGGTTVYPGDQNVSTARDMGAYMRAVLDFARRHPDLGNRLLDDMANSIYHIGLPGELPPGLRVAHKEGDYTGVTDDVGIVYAQRPFIFCVLSDGQPDPEAGFADIAHLTKIAYDFQLSLK
ncbi:MAG: serine hydrolase [Chitinophagales bacterium]